MDVTARELGRHSSALLDRVERGEEITVTRHGRPVARMIPIGRWEIPPRPASPIGDVDLPVLDFAEPMSDEESAAMGGKLRDAFSRRQSAPQRPDLNR
ncbi:type II toxin-antitoxin system Phd/YefM family antitoxin [Streptomyces sp. NPDC057694]|uniref:type II toxin-antitoxin system Phd/YefM family antitoxin n=1 Tax=Streptomyces sp. NPDC057694 TaxID=3346216 RepID=UPI0036BE263F